MKTKINFGIAIAIISFAIGCTRNGMDSQNDREPDRTSGSTVKHDSLQVTSTSNSAENVDSMFLSAALQSGLFEVQLGELTQKLASSPEVKSFGKSMTIDHGKANQELRALATKLNLSHSVALIAKSQAKLDSLSGLKGATFDEAYSVVMIKAHRDAIEAFTEEGTKGNYKELVTWSNAKIPTLKHHLLMAEKMHNSVDQTPGRH